MDSAMIIKVYDIGVSADAPAFRLRLYRGDEVRRDVSTGSLDRVTRTLTLWRSWGAVLSDDDETQAAHAFYERLEDAQ